MNYKTVEIEKLEKNVFLHYTNKSNLDNIMKKGLEPRIGDNAYGFESHEKVFFTVGITNSLILMESWLKWLIAKSGIDLPGKKLDRPMSNFAHKIIKIKIFPQFLINMFVKLELNTKYKKINAYKTLKEILDNSVYLKLDLENNVDYIFDDYDEIKNSTYNRNLLRLMYSYNSDVNDKQMEYWNMHTIFEKTIEPYKISIVTVNGSSKASDILEYMRRNSEIKIKKELPYLYGYFKWLYNNYI